MPFVARLCAGASFAALAVFPAHAADSKAETIIVTGVRDQQDLPNTIADVDADQAAQTINAVNSEDMLKYLPSILVRKRHYGDTQDPLATRTSGVGSSARGLLFVDGVLISSPIGNNNTSASPHFGVAAPQDIANFEVLYGPFAAEYGGGSMGAVLNITTRMPDHLEIRADALGAVQDFSQYATHGSFGTWQLAAEIGDREGAFSWRLSANHLDSLGQPLAYVTLSQPASANTAGAPVSGAFAGLNRTAQPIAIVGAGGIEAQAQDTDTVKLAYDFANGWQASYLVSVFHQQDDATAQSYLRDGAGTPVYAGNVNIGGYNYNIGASSFSTNVYDWNQTHLAQGASLKSGNDGAFRWELIASAYDYLDDSQFVPGMALPLASAGGAGSITRMNGTGWITLDAKGVWSGWKGHSLSFGAHRDQEGFSQIKYNTADWMGGAPGTVAALAKGRTATNALWLQDIWHFAPDWQAILGGRYEDWRAYDGVNLSTAPVLNVGQPRLSTSAFSPKASLAWQVSGNWSLRASYGSAFRMPTVTELYQAVTTGTQLTVPNPDLKPEHADSYELAADRVTDSNRVRLSFFQETVRNALLSQSAPLVAGSTTLYSYVQNVDRTLARGVELVADQKDIVSGVEFSGSITYVDGRTVKDTAFPAAVGKAIPQLPRWRATLVATWRPDFIDQQRLAVTLAARYGSRSYGTIDNSDPVSRTFQGFGSYLVADARLHYRLDDKWSTAIGIDNLTNDKYFLYHPFPQRTFVMEIHYAQ